MLGVILALYFFAKRHKQDFMWLLSRTAMPGMLTAAFVRIGNLFNSEILGLPTDKPWAIIFARIDMTPRHPVQLYEAFSYFFILAILVWVYRKSSFGFATKLLTGMFFFLLFTARFLLEYTKTEQADYATNIPLTVGQMLSVPFVLLGLVWIIWAWSSTPKEKRWQATH
jgi:prolipoprotein diacylglyceryl transferase